MRLWSIHPAYLDPKGLVALWRESLLAQKVLQGLTKGYKNHPQLERFKKTDNPLGAIADYLREIEIEATKRGYKFNGQKINSTDFKGNLSINSGQLQYEFYHLLKKLKQREKNLYLKLKKVQDIKPHPLFRKRKGEVASWEKVNTYEKPSQ